MPYDITCHDHAFGAEDLLGRAVPPKLENDCVVRVFQEYLVSFTYPLPTARCGFWGGFSA